MAQLSAVFQISVYALCCLASVMLAVADETLWPHIITLPLAVAALVVTERKQIFQLPATWTNVLGTIASIYTLWQMSPLFLRLLRGGGIPEEGVIREVVIASHFLIFLMWIVFFLQKHPREYWAMCTLSVLLVAIGALLTTSGVYGILLACYVFLGIWTLSIFSIEQARIQLAETAEIVGTTDNRLEGNGKTHSMTRAARGGPTGLTAYWQQPSTPRNSIHLDPGERWISARFVGGMLATALASIAISSCFVVLTPRVWAGRISTLGTMEDDQAPLETGFSETVELGGESRISESNDLALEVQIFDDSTGEELDVAEYATKIGYEEPLFRGAVLDTYENHKWSTVFTDTAPVATYNDNASRGARQEIRIQPMQSGVLFAMFPVRQCKLNEQNYVACQNGADVLMRYRRTEVEVLHILRGNRTKGSGIPFTKPVELTIASPLARRTKGLAANNRDDSYDRAYLRLPQGLDKLKALARETADEARSNGRTTDDEIAQALESYLKDTKDFVYTLDIEAKDPSIDPLEDFLFNTKAGHCEYYASALTLMLRAAGIRSRLVSGFKGGSLNQFSGTFEVQQRYAHAWVEALIGDRWITLDPTPSRERSEAVRRAAPQMLTLADLKSFLGSLWSNYVANADFSRQKSQIYQPLAEWARSWWTAIKEHQVGFPQFVSFVRGVLSSPRQWFSWQGALATIVLIAIGIPGYFLSKRAAKALRRLWQFLFRRTELSRDVVAFYERFRKICRARGLVRERWQTQREFVMRVDQSLNAYLASAGLAAFPRHLVDRFYDVRFGRIPLDDATAAELDQNLSRLEQSLKSPNGHA